MTTKQIEELIDEIINLNEALKEQTTQIMEMEKRIIALERAYGDKPQETSCTGCKHDFEDGEFVVDLAVAKCLDCVNYDKYEE